VKILSALFTKIFIRAGGFIHDADTASMLPYFARVALNKEASRFIGQQVWSKQRRLFFGASFDRSPSKQHASRDGEAWVVCLAADTPCDLLFVAFFLFILFICRRRLGGSLVVACAALSVAGVGWFGGEDCRIIDGLRSLG
jgi:hypothetical protein